MGDAAVSIVTELGLGHSERKRDWASVWTAFSRCTHACTRTLFLLSCFVLACFALPCLRWAFLRRRNHLTMQMLLSYHPGPVEPCHSSGVLPAMAMLALAPLHKSIACTYCILRYHHASTPFNQPCKGRVPSHAFPYLLDPFSHPSSHTHTYTSTICPLPYLTQPNTSSAYPEPHHTSTLVHFTSPKRYIHTYHHHLAVSQLPASLRTLHLLVHLLQA